MAMSDAKPSGQIPMPSRDRDRDRDLLVQTTAVATHAFPSARTGADSDGDESKPSSASAAAAAAQTGREVSHRSLSPSSHFRFASHDGGFSSQIWSVRQMPMRELLWNM